MYVGRSPSYLVRQDHGYCFRAHVPPDIQPHFRLKELRYSLGLVTRRQARVKASKLGRYVWELFEKARHDINTQGYTMLDRKQIKDLIYKYFKEQLKADEEWRLERGRPATPEELEGEGMALSDMFDEVDDALPLMDLSKAAPKVQQLLEAEAIADIETDSLEWRRLALEMLKAQSFLLRIFDRRTEGDMLGEAKLKKEYVEVLGGWEGALGSPGTTREKPPIVKPIKDAIEMFKSEKTAAGSYTVGSAVDVYFSLDLFRELVGVAYMHLLDHETIGVYFDRLKNWPANRTKKKIYKDLTTEELIKLQVPEKDRVSQATINKHMVWVSNFMDWAEKRGFVKKNYARGIKMPKPSRHQRDDEKTGVFTKEQLEMLFGSPEYRMDRFKEDWQFYIPVMALFTGMRQSEIAQLDISDVKQIDGIWCINLENEDRGTTAKKRLKTKSSRRTIPLHDFLVIDLQLPALLDKRRSEGHSRLFPTIRYQNAHYGDVVSKWFGRYRKSLGINSEPGAPKLVFHSFRHTFINQLKQRRVDIQSIAEVVGHSTGSITAERYGKRYEPGILKREVIDRLDFGIDLSHLMSSRWVIR